MLIRHPVKENFDCTERGKIFNPEPIGFAPTTTVRLFFTYSRCNVVTHVDRNCFRGPRPKDLKELVDDFGIDTIIDLESGVYDFLNGVIPQFPPDLGMDYYHMPCSDIFAPHEAYVVKCLDLMSDPGRITYIHCLSGVDRTGFVCAVYRMRVQKWSYKDAVWEWVVKMNRHPWYFYWESELKKYGRVE